MVHIPSLIDRQSVGINLKNRTKKKSSDCFSHLSHAMIRIQIILRGHGYTVSRPCTDNE